MGSCASSASSTEDSYHAKQRLQPKKMHNEPRHFSPDRQRGQNNNQSPRRRSNDERRPNPPQDRQRGPNDNQSPRERPNDARQQPNSPPIQGRHQQEGPYLPRGGGRFNQPADDFNLAKRRPQHDGANNINDLGRFSFELIKYSHKDLSRYIRCFCSRK